MNAIKIVTLCLFASAGVLALGSVDAATVKIITTRSGCSTKLKEKGFKKMCVSCVKDGKKFKRDTKGNWSCID